MEFEVYILAVAFAWCGMALYAVLPVNEEYAPERIGVSFSYKIGSGCHAAYITREIGGFAIDRNAFTSGFV